MNEKDEKWFEKLTSDKKFRADFSKGLKRLGFPLEFKIRKKLADEGYQNISEGYFTSKVDGRDITRSYDFSGYKSSKKIILKDLTINMDIKLLGDCKFSSDPEKFIFAIPEEGEFGNKTILSPILSAFHSVCGMFGKYELASNFISNYGAIFLASNLRDVSKSYIMRDNDKKDDTPDFERIYNICEATILPALYEKFIYWRKSLFSDLSRIFYSMPASPDEGCDCRSFLGHEFLPFNFFVPIIVTSKPILCPVIKDGEISDIKKINLVLYNHPIKTPDVYSNLIGNSYTIGVFVCNEEGFGELLKYIENIGQKLLEKVSSEIERNPNRLYDEYKRMKD